MDPDLIAAFRAINASRQDCYQRAARRLLELPAATKERLHHGELASRGQVLAHAWLSTSEDGRRFRSWVSYSRAEMLDLILRTGHCGPWEE